MCAVGQCGPLSTLSLCAASRTVKDRAAVARPRPRKRRRRGLASRVLHRGRVVDADGPPPCETGRSRGPASCGPAYRAATPTSDARTGRPTCRADPPRSVLRRAVSPSRRAKPSQHADDVNDPTSARATDRGMSTNLAMRATAHRRTGSGADGHGGRRRNSRRSVEIIDRRTARPV